VWVSTHRLAGTRRVVVGRGEAVGVLPITDHGDWNYLAGSSG
jgi:hypothetical protein